MDNERGERIEKKVDQIVDTISEINVTLAKQSVVLDEHIRRTALLEQAVDLLKHHQSMVSGVIKFISIIAALAALIELFLR